MASQLTAYLKHRSTGRPYVVLKLAATHMAAARCFEEGRFNDMRMPAMGSQIATCLRQMDKLIESA